MNSPLIQIQKILLKVFKRSNSNNDAVSEKLLQINRLYVTLSQINQIIVRVHNRDLLFHKICEVAVNYGMFRLAWIGTVDEQTQQVKVEAYAGEEQGYLSSIKISVSDNELNKGPVGRAIIGKECVFSQDIANDPNMKPWHKEALKRGFFSIAAVPICQNYRPIGAFVVYAPEIMIFDEQELHLIEKIGIDISFALDMIERKEQRTIAMRALHKSENLYHTLFENAPNGIFIVDHVGRFLDVNALGIKMIDCSYDELLEKSMFDFTLDTDQISKEIYNIIENRPYRKEWDIKRKNGEVFVGEVYCSQIPDNKILIILTDISERKRTEKLLREGEDKYRHLFENNPQPMWIYDQQTFNFLEINQAAVRHYGYSRDEFLKMTFSDICLKEIEDSVISNEENKERKSDHAKVWRCRKKNGEVIIVEVVSHAINFDSRKSWLVLSNDITERRQAEARLRTLSRTVEQNPASIIITNTKGNIEYVNPKFTQITGYSFEEVQGKKSRILNSGHASPELFDNMWNTIKSGEVWQNEYLNRKKDKTKFWENATISPLLDYKGQITNFIIISEDVSEKKKMMDDLVQAKKKAEESDHLKTAFLHNISHEIRTPMNAIVGFSSLLNDRDLTDENCNRFTNIIIQSSNQLLSIITDIVNIATLEAGQEKIWEKDVNLNSTLALLYDQFLAKIRNTDINLAYTTSLLNKDAYIKADETKLNEILSNLISNALKFTREGEIQFGYHVKDNFLEFYVKDTGIGIPSEMHEEIFKRFRQIELSYARQLTGSGLGLSISKAYVELLGGKIWVESEEGKGSTFFFTIPYKQAIIN
jgi:PAS domain S-box-containing protein